MRASGRISDGHGQGARGKERKERKARKREDRPAEMGWPQGRVGGCAVFGVILGLIWVDETRAWVGDYQRGGSGGYGSNGICGETPGRRGGRGSQWETTTQRRNGK